MTISLLGRIWKEQLYLRLAPQVFTLPEKQKNRWGLSTVSLEPRCLSVQLTRGILNQALSHHGWCWLSSPDLGGSRQTQGAQAWETELFQSTTSWDSDLTWICRQFDESWWNKIKITENRQNLLYQFGQRSQSSKRWVGRQPGGWGPERKAGKRGSAGYQLFVLGQVTTLMPQKPPLQRSRWCEQHAGSSQECN